MDVDGRDRYSGVARRGSAEVVGSVFVGEGGGMGWRKGII